VHTVRERPAYDLGTRARGLLPVIGMSVPTPVHVEVNSPPRFERTQLFVRLLLALVLGLFGITLGWITVVLYLTLPLLAAIAITTIGTARFSDELAPRIRRALTWLLQLSAFTMLLTDRFPTTADPDVRVDMPIGGRPTATTALVRLASSAPSAFVLCFLSVVSGVLWIIGAFSILIAETVPSSILAYQRGLLRWQARLAAYHASLVDDYPPFTIDTGVEDHDRELAGSEAH